MTGKMRERASVSCDSYRRQVGDRLKLLLDGLESEVKKMEEETESRVREVNEDIRQCTHLQQTARTLK